MIRKYNEMINDKLSGFPLAVIDKMLYYQTLQGNKRDITVFQRETTQNQNDNGFTWNDTREGYDFWNAIIINKNFNLFFEKYPKYQIIEIW